MSILTALHDSYKKCEESKLVNKHDNPDGVILLPLFHTNLRSSGNNIVKVVINKNSKLIRAEFVEDKKIVMFPITEDSITRTSGAAPHPLVDQLSYIHFSINPTRHELYSQEFSKWIEFNSNTEEGTFLRIIQSYLENEDVLTDIADQIADGREYSIDAKYVLTYVELDDRDKEKIVKIDLSKVFVTFEIIGFIEEKNFSVDNYKALHDNYIEYQRKEHINKEKEYCNISGEKTYCTNKHRGILGSSKLIGVSNNDETYIGRFNNGEQIVKIGYETSQRIHNMLKYLLENKLTSKWLGENSYLVTWYSDDISNENNRLSATSPEEFEGIMGGSNTEDIEDFYSPGKSYTKSIGKSIFGNELDRLEREKVYIMIVDKSSPGRVAIKYYREFYQSEYYFNILNWNETVKWEMYNFKEKKFTLRTPSIFEIVDYSYGIERDGRIVFDNKKFRLSLIERLLPSVIEGKKIPRDLVVKLFNNVSSRNRYKNRWGMLLSITCAIISKYKYDYFGERTVEDGGLKMLEESKQSRSFIFGRILCLLEQTELAIYKDFKATRPTNAQRMWSVYTKAPAKIMMQLKNKLQPYELRLMKSNEKRGYYVILQKKFKELIVLLEATEDFEINKNKHLDEDFILGYYLQKDEFINWKSKNKTDEEDDN